MTRAFADTFAFLAWLNPDDGAHDRVTAFLDLYAGQLVTTEWVLMEVAVYEADFTLFASRPDKSWSLTDCISFAVMNRDTLTEALTGDRHFEQAGFHAVFRDER